MKGRPRRMPDDTRANNTKQILDKVEHVNKMYNYFKEVMSKGTKSDMFYCKTTAEEKIVNLEWFLDLIRSC